MNLICTAEDFVGHRHYWVLGTMPRCEKKKKKKFCPTCVRGAGTPQIVNPQGYILDKLENRIRFSAAGEALFFSEASTLIAGHIQYHIQSASGTTSQE